MLYKTLHILIQKDEGNKDSCFQIINVLNVYSQQGTVVSAKGSKDT